MSHISTPVDRLPAIHTVKTLHRVATRQQLDAFIGQIGSILAHSFGCRMSVRVKVEDARVRFGQIELLVTPVAGDGQGWVEAQRVNLGDRTI